MSTFSLLLARLPASARFSLVVASDVFLDAWPWPPGQIFIALALALKVKALALRAEFRFFGIILKLNNNLYVINNK